MRCPRLVFESDYVDGLCRTLAGGLRDLGRVVLQGAPGTIRVRLLS